MASPLFPQKVRNWVQSFAPGDTTTAKTLVTGGTNASRIEFLLVSSTDTSARDIVVSWLYLGIAYVITTISIPANSGNTNSLPAVDLFRNPQFAGLPVDALGNKYMYVAAGFALQLGMGTTITAAKQVNAFAHGGDY